MTDDRERRPQRRVDLVLDLWVLAPVVVLSWPLLTLAGHPFARDLVFTPRLPLRPEALGLGTGSPRAAPLDAVVGLLSAVVDGALVGRVVVVLVLAAAGWAAHRLVRPLGLAARALAGALAVWNPFVVERLGLGQWALLAGYAALFGVAAALRPAPRSGQRPTRSRAARLAPWLALGALTPTGAVLVGITTVVLGVRSRRDTGVLALAAAAQLPWLLPALLGGAAAVSDPAAVVAFAARAERAGPAFLSLVGLGGIWDGQSVPGSRTGWLGHLTTVLVVLVLLVAGRRGLGPSLPGRGPWWWGFGGLAVATLTSVGPVGDVVAALTGVVPGLGLLRDGQKWLAPFVVVTVVAAAVAADTGLRAVRRSAPVLAPTALALVLLAPFALLPDATVVVHRVLTPVTYPTELETAVEVVAADPGPVASAPWRLYRESAWSGPYATHDPASRLFDARVVTSDDLVLGDREVRGEDPVARAVGDVVTRPGPATAAGLAALGVRWVLVAADDPAAPRLVDALAATPGVERPVTGPAYVLFGLQGASAAGVAAAEVDPATVWFVALVDLAVVLALAVVWVVPRLGRTARRSVTVA